MTTLALCIWCRALMAVSVMQTGKIKQEEKLHEKENQGHEHLQGWHAPGYRFLWTRP